MTAGVQLGLALGQLVFLGTIGLCLAIEKVSHYLRGKR